MAFVNRSQRILNPDMSSPTNIGPGEYLNNGSKEKARNLHRLSNIFTHPSKLNPLDLKIPFNTTGERKSFLIKENSNPGPGAYNDINTENNIKNKLPIFTLKDEIIFVEENDDLVPKIKNEKKGFLSSEKRFYEKIDINYNNKNTEYDNYKFNRRYNTDNDNEKLHNSRYSKNGFNINKNKLTHRSLLSSTNSIPSIPNKNQFDYKYINGNLEKIKKISNSAKKEEDNIGPGQYDVFPKWNSNVINWNYGFNKESKITSYKNKLLSDLKEHKKIEQVNLSVKLSNKKLQKNISHSDILLTDNSQNLSHKKNNSMRNQVFNRHIKDRKKILAEPMNKQKKYNDIMNQIQYKETPGPGFYNNKNHPIIFNTNKTQSFGSNTPKFIKIGYEDRPLGPGSYFLEKNKYQPKIEVSVHIKNPERKNLIKTNEGLYIKNNRLKNRYRYPGPGQYDLSKNFIKDEISNVKSFGILDKRFKYKDLNSEKDDKYNDYIDEKMNRHLYLKTNFDYDNKMQYKINRKLLEMKREEEILKKKRRDKFMNKKSPGVGDYSPEFSTSISYNVQSKVNKFRNMVAPFNIMNSRFSEMDKFFQSKDIPGPGDYDVADAYDALNNGIKSGYINNHNSSVVDNNNLVKLKNNEEKSTPGPGLYDQNVTNSWNKKTFNVLFMDK